MDFFVGSPDPALVHLAEAVFSDLASPRRPEGDLPCFVIAGSAGSRDEPRYDVSGPVIGRSEALPLAMAITRIVTALGRATLDVEPDRLHLHAGAVVADGLSGCSWPCRRETGKTTAVACPALHGWTDLSDETVSIGPRDQFRSRGSPSRSLLKSGSCSLLPELASHFLPHGETSAAGRAARQPRRRRGRERRCGCSRDGRTPTEGSESAAVRGAGRTGRSTQRTPSSCSWPKRWMQGGSVIRAGVRARPIGHPHQLLGDLGRGSRPDGRRRSSGCSKLLKRQRLEVRDLGQGMERVRSNVTSVLIADRVVVHELPEGRILSPTSWPCRSG